MAEEVVVDQPVDAGSPTNDGAVKPAAADKPVQTSTQVAAPDRKAEDERNRGILADLQKERKARQDFERQANSYRTQYEAERQRVQALAGLRTPTETEAEANLVRQRLGQIIPGLEGLTKEDIQALRDLRTQGAQFQAAEERRNFLAGRQTLDAVIAGITKEVGGTLTERQSNRVKRAFISELEADPELLDRYDNGDPNVIPEFIKQYAEDFFEPARRKVLANEVDRQRKVPSGRDRSIASTGGKKIDFNNPKAVEDALVESFKSHGGAFGE
jgi:hypothetical protein